MGLAGFGLLLILHIKIMILYTAIARRDATVLVEAASQGLRGNFSHITLQLLEHLRDHPTFLGHNERKTLVQSNENETDFFSNFIEACSAVVASDDNEDVFDHFFHLFCFQECYYVCLADDPELRDQKVAYAFLDHIQHEFCHQYRPGRIKNANAYAFDRNFKPSLRSAMHYYNTKHDTIAQDAKVQALHVQIDRMKQVMGMHLQLLLERGDDLSRLTRKSDAMQEDVEVFRRRASRGRRKQAVRMYLTMGIGIFVLLVVLVLLSLAVCGIGYKYCRNPASGGGSDYSGGKRFLA